MELKSASNCENVTYLQWRIPDFTLVAFLAQ
jgi:hypothetical protein